MRWQAGRVALSLDPAAATVQSLGDLASGRALLRGGTGIRSPICQIRAVSAGALTDGESPSVDVVLEPCGPPEPASDDPGGRREAPGAFALTYSSSVDRQGRIWPVGVTVTVEPAAGSAATGGASVWRLRVENRTRDLAVVEVLFPLLRGLAWSPLAGDDELVFPHHAGERCARPAEVYRSARYQAFWRAGTVEEAPGLYAREITYCGLASMMWLDYFDGAGGFYLGSHDPEFLLTGMRVEVHAPPGAPATLGFGIRKFRPIVPGESWCTPGAVVAFHDGDWHQGARLYRAWFEGVGMPSTERLGGPPVPDDLVEEPALLPFYELRREQGVLHRFSELPGIYDEISERYGARHFFLAGWNRSGFDSQYPEYHPDLDLGSPMTLKRVVDHVGARGGFTTFYINSRLFDRGSFYHPTLGREWAIRDLDGQTHREKYGPVEFDVCCPAHAGWQEHLLDFGEWMVRAYGARGIYYDQLGSATPWACYHPGHSHREGGAVHSGRYNAGYVRLLEEASRRLRAVRPDSFLMIENCGDLYSTRVWGSLTWNGTLYDEFFNLFKYTFPETVLVQMVQTRSAVPVEQQPAIFRRDLDAAWLLGSVLWLHAPRLERPGGVSADEVARMLAEVQAVLALKRSVAGILRRTRFADTDGLSVNYRHASHWLGEREHLVLLVPGGAGRPRGEGGGVRSVRVRVAEGGSRPWVFTRWVARAAEPVASESGACHVKDGEAVLELGTEPGEWEAWHLEPAS